MFRNNVLMPEKVRVFGGAFCEDIERLKVVNKFRKKAPTQTFDRVQKTSQLTFTCSNTPIETLEKMCEICSKLTIITAERR